MSAIDDMLSKKVWAVVGVSTDKAKFGYRVYDRLKKSGYRVYAINPNLSEIDGERVYPDLDSLPETPEVVNFVVPPSVTAGIIGRCAERGIKYAWLQPGSESREILAKCKEKNVEALRGCVMTELRKRT